MKKYIVSVNYPVTGFEYREFEVVASSEEEAKSKTVRFIEGDEGEEVIEIDEGYYDDMNAVSEGKHGVDYAICVGEAV